MHLFQNMQYEIIKIVPVKTCQSSFDSPQGTDDNYTDAVLLKIVINWKSFGSTTYLKIF